MSSSGQANLESRVQMCEGISGRTCGVSTPRILTAGGEKIQGVKHTSRETNMSNLQTTGSTRCPKEQSASCLWGCLGPWLGSGSRRTAWPADNSHQVVPYWFQKFARHQAARWCRNADFGDSHSCQTQDKFRALSSHRVTADPWT